MTRIFGMCPGTFTVDILADLAPVFCFLTCDLGVPAVNFHCVIEHDLVLLVSSVERTLLCKVEYLALELGHCSPSAWRTTSGPSTWWRRWGGVLRSSRISHSTSPSA
ncbi:hypothetical protein Taro_052964 [Colocasia esculenta]|uniref:Uncharacterized protein n=1 Tax=Colocasia esculenta TaxID=4460 RepID=A0A843XL83_COLES|nr:hypothetical protein [Colocasia esculenta]